MSLKSSVIKRWFWFLGQKWEKIEGYPDVAKLLNTMKCLPANTIC